MKKKINSFKDSKGKLWVACTECERGANGQDANKCGGAAMNKKFSGVGCFSGTLISTLQGVL